MAEVMHKDMLIRAWKDEQFRNSLPEEQRAAIPEAPEGVHELSDDELEAAAGGTTPLCGAAAIGIYKAAAVGVGAGAASAVGGEIVEEVGERTWDSGE